MGFGEAIRTCLSKYATRSGRAPRSEYWYWLLFVIIATLVGGIIAEATGVIVIRNISGLVLLPPSLAVGVRRLHDLDCSGRWYLLGLVPWICPIALFVEDLVVGYVGRGFIIIIYVLVSLAISIVLTVWACTRGTLGPNRDGPDPLADAISAVSAPS